MDESEVRLELQPRHSHVDFYIKHLPEPRHSTIHALRENFHRWVPNLQESMHYRIPTFVTHAIICTLASQKKYMSLMICHTEILDKYRDKLHGLRVGRATIRFDTLQQLPMQVIESIIRESAEFLDHWLGKPAN